MPPKAPCWGRFELERDTGGCPNPEADSPVGRTGTSAPPGAAPTPLLLPTTALEGGRRITSVSRGGWTPLVLWLGKEGCPGLTREPGVRSGVSTATERGTVSTGSGRPPCCAPNCPPGAGVGFREPLRTGCPKGPRSGPASVRGAVPPPAGFDRKGDASGRTGSALGTPAGLSPTGASPPLDTFPERTPPAQGAGAGVEAIPLSAAFFSAAVGAVKRTVGPLGSFAVEEVC